jgi:diguanylate cyclase (GGDEF)-like protein
LEQIVPGEVDDIPRSQERVGADRAQQATVDLMVAPLRRDNKAIGVMSVANRLGDVASFDEVDVKLFETLANHASVALEKDRLEETVAQLTSLEEQLKHQAYHDSLTGLPNRTLFTNRVEHSLKRRDHSENPTAVLFIDLDDFKTINDSLGHAAGDELLIKVARRLQDSLRPTDTAARLAGDEFAILLERVKDENEAAAVASRIIESFEAALSIDGKEIAINTSIGIAVSRPQLNSAGDLLRNADVAMYRAKALGKGQCALFEPSITRQCSSGCT